MGTTPRCPSLGVQETKACVWVGVTVSGKVSSKGSSGAMRTLPRKQLTSSNMTRSISMGRLNQSDSESDLGLAQRPLGSSRVNGFNRPTISSQNKVTANQNSGCKTNLNGPTNRRRGLTGAQSSTTLNQVGNNEDSSSEETSSVGGKPVPSMRPRSTSIERFSGAPLSLPAHSGQPQPPPRRGSSIHGRYNSERDLSRTARDVTQRLTSANRGKPVPAARHHGLETGSQDSLLDNVASAPLSEQLCSAVAEQLTRSIDNFSQLHQRLALEGDQDLLKTLEQTASEALQTLRQVSPSTPAPVAPPANPTEDGKNVVAMMQQYSDLLVNMVQQRMGQNSPAAQKPS